MSTNITLFGGNTSLPALPEDFQDNLTDRLAGGGSGGRRISIRGSAFREIVNGKEVRVSEERSMNIVLINAAPISRMYYDSEYDADAAAVAPSCWSSDTETPDPQVPADQRQANRCTDCPKNIKGSGKGDSRACKYQQRVAVLLEGEIDKKEVYQLQLPATSVFGDGTKDSMPLQAYGRFLKAHNTHAISIVTKMRFDIDASVPTLTFSAVRPLSQDELDVAVEMRDSPAAINAITMSVGETDGAKAGEKKAEKKAEKPAEKPAAKKVEKKPEPEPDTEEEAVEVEEVVEPKKMASKSSAKEAPINVSSLLDEWDD